MRWVLAAACTVLLGAAILSGSPPLARHEFEQPHMGTRVRVVLYAASRAQAERAAAAAFREMAAVDAAMSDYKPDSGISRLSDAAGRGWFPVPRELLRVLEASQEISAATDGAFDVTVGPLVRLWRRARKERRLPTEEERERARALAAPGRLHLRREPPSAMLATAGMRLDLGGIAKGHACDRALAALAREGVTRALVDTGGGLALGAPPPGRPGWTIAMIGDASRILVLSRRGIATSGDTEQFVVIGGVRYSHIVDPRTGLGLVRQEMATVIAPTATEADALATAFCVLGAPRAIEIAAARPGVEAWLQWVESRRRRRAETPAFERLAINQSD